jgi:hypothetical protein
MYNLFQYLKNLLKLGESLSWAQSQHLLFGHTHIFFKNLNIKEMINNS